MRKNKINTLILTTLLCLGMNFPAYAKTDAYLLGNYNIGYEFNKADLTKSFLKHKGGEASLLFNEYIKFSKEKDVYAFHDDTNKYVDYKKIVEEFLITKNNGTIFNLDKITENTPSKTKLPSQIFEVKDQDGNIVYLEKKQENNNKKNVEKPKPSIQVEELKVLNIE